MLLKAGTLARSTMAATPTPTQIAAQSATPSLSAMPVWVATQSVMPAMTAPAAVLRIADCSPCSLPPQWKKQPQAMNAAQIASAPPSGPRKSQVAMAPSTPTLIARAVFVDISPPLFGGRAGGCAGRPAVHRLTDRSLFLCETDSASGRRVAQSGPGLNKDSAFCPIHRPKSRVG